MSRLNYLELVDMNRLKFSCAAALVVIPIEHGRTYLSFSLTGALLCYSVVVSVLKFYVMLLPCLILMRPLAFGLH